MKQVDFIFYYEHWQRELYGILFMKKELERRGYSVAVCGQGWHKEYSLTTYDCVPRVVIFPWIYSDDNLRSARWFPKRVDKVVNMQCEQIYSDYTVDTGWHKIRGEARKAWHVAWGPKMKERYLQWGVSEDHILSTGSVNLDLLNERHKNLLYTKAELAKKYGINPEKRWVIFYSSFTLTQVPKKELEGMMRNISPEMADLKEAMSLSKEAILRWVEDYLASHPSDVLLYRLHPSERNDVRLKELAKGNDRFFYFSDLTAIHWIKACDRVLSWISTSMADAHFAGKPFALLRPCPLPPRLEPELFEGADMIETYKDFCTFLEIAKPQTLIQEHVFRSFFSNARNVDAHLSLCDALESLYHAEESVDYAEDVRVRCSFRQQSVLKKVFILIFTLAEKANISPLLFFHKRWRKILWEVRQKKKNEKIIWEQMERDS